ncbi:MAG TPA: hypothetical protein VIX84_05130 [Acidimicrobiales bacterium]
MEETLSVAEAACRLGITTEQALTLIFLKELDSIEAPSGRRIVPVWAIERWQSSHAAPA